MHRWFISYFLSVVSICCYGVEIKDPTAPLFIKKEKAIEKKMIKPFSDRYILQSIFISSKKRMVIINNKEYVQGDSFDGYVLHKVFRDHVLLSKGNKKKSLWLYPGQVNIGGRK